MTPEQIEAALELAPHAKQIKDLAQAEINVKTALQAFESETDNRDEGRWEGWMEDLTDMKEGVFEDIAGAFDLSIFCTATVQEIVEDHYKGIKARLLSPEYRLKDAVK